MIENSKERRADLRDREIKMLAIRKGVAKVLIPNDSIKSGGYQVIASDAWPFFVCVMISTCRSSWQAAKHMEFVPVTVYTAPICTRRASAEKNAHA
jgi:hypothetical protein